MIPLYRCSDAVSGCRLQGLSIQIICSSLFLCITLKGPLVRNRAAVKNSSEVIFQVMLSPVLVQTSFKYSQIYSLGAFTIFDGRLLYSFTILILKKFYCWDYSALWWKILNVCPLVDRLLELSCCLGIMLFIASLFFSVISMFLLYLLSIFWLEIRITVLHCNVDRSNFHNCSS